MSKSLQPLLAAKVDDVEQLDRLQYPVFVSPKLDGIRLRIDPELGGVSRTHKPIPNQHIQQQIKENATWIHYLDGEVIIGMPTAPDVFNKTQSAVMSQSGTPDWSYYIFDDWRDPAAPYCSRMKYVQTALPYGRANNIDLHYVTQNLCEGTADVLRCEERYLKMGYEGVIIRSTNGRYKNGRSTFKEGTLLKFKRIEDAEATVTGFQELEHNANEPIKDNFGYTRRQSVLGGMVKGGVLGALIVTHPEFGAFQIGSGFDANTRDEIWKSRDSYMGRTVTFVFQRAGMKDKPRFPIFKGFRHD